MDSPYYIKHIEHRHNGADYQIVSSSRGPICLAHGIEQARMVVDALNRDHAHEKASQDDRRFYPGGDVSLADTAGGT